MKKRTLKQRIRSFRFIWCYYFGGYIEEEDAVYGFYGKYPALFRNMKESIKNWFSSTHW